MTNYRRIRELEYEITALRLELNLVSQILTQILDNINVNLKVNDPVNMDSGKWYNRRPEND